MAAIVEAIRNFNEGRDPERLAIKYRKMRASAFPFLRGTCHWFYQSLPEAGILRDSPVTWVCGDLHFENFGSYRGDNRLVYFDINDFDESALAPCAWDLLRFLTSLLVGGDTLVVDRLQARTLCDAFLESYSEALRSGKARWVERETADGLVRSLFDGVAGRTHEAFMANRIEHKSKRIRLRTDGKKALPVTAGQRKRVASLLGAFARGQDDPDFFEVLDVARRVAGTGSLGADRYVILAKGDGKPDGAWLLDLKQVLPSSLSVPLRNLQLRQPAWPSESCRAVAIQKRMQAVSMALLHAVQLGRTPCVLRELQPSEDRVELDQWRKLSHLADAIRTMGQTVAWAELRSGGRDGSAITDELIAFGSESTWRRELIEVAEHCAAETEAAWREFSAAYDEGAFADQCV